MLHAKLLQRLLFCRDMSNSTIDLPITERVCTELLQDNGLLVYASSRFTDPHWQAYQYTNDGNERHACL